MRRGEPELSIVISTLGNHAMLKRVLDGYARQDARSDRFEVLVVMDAAEEQPEEVERAIASRPYPVRRLSGRIPGLSANRNAGWRVAKAPVVLFTDNDTIPVRRLVSEHIRWHRRHPSVEVAVVGQVRWSRELEITPFMRWLDHGVQFNFPSIKGTQAGWGHLYGANSSIKRGFVERVGGYDEERLPYLYEDLDFAFRASKLGLRVLYNRRAIVDHYRPGMTPEFWQEKVRRYAATERQFLRIHPELEPYFFNMFSSATRLPPARGRGLRLARFVPRRLPWLGPYVWKMVDIYFRQQLAPHFLEAWEEAAGAMPSASWLAESSDGGSDQPSRSEAAGTSLGSKPGGS